MSHASSLRINQKLLRSHLSIAGIGLVLMVVGLIATLWLRSITVRLATLRGPMVESSLEAVNAVEQSVSLLRGWVATGDPRYKLERAQVWSDQVRPSVARLESFVVRESDLAEGTSLALLAKGLDDLEELQWWIEDVAGTPGNEPAQSVLDLEVVPVGDSIFLAATALIDEEKALPAGPVRRQLLAEMADFRAFFAFGWNVLSEFMVAGTSTLQRRCLQHLDRAKESLALISQQKDLLNAEQVELLNLIQQDFPAFQAFAEKAIRLRQEPDWHIAEHALGTEAKGLEQQVADLLHRISRHQSELMAADAERAQTDSNITIALLAAMIGMMGVAALVVSKRNSARITDPIVRLSASAAALAEGHLDEDIPSSSEDEIGSLIHAFNTMRRAVQASRASLEGKVEERTAAMRESNELVRLLLDSTAEAIYGLDLDGQCTWCNSACLKMLGYTSSDELLGKNMHDLAHHTRPDGSPYPKEECRIYQSFRRGEGTHVTDEVLWRKDGTRFPAEYWSYPIRHEDEVVGSVVTFLDITERIRAEEALHESEARASTILEGAKDGIISINRHGIIDSFSAGAERMFGYTADEVIGQNVKILMPLPDQERHDGYLQSYLKTGQRKIIGLQREGIGQRKDGSTFPVDLAISEITI